MAISTSSPWLKSTEWLAGQLGKPGVSIVDGSYYLPTQKRDPKAEYVAGHIPGAVFFDINAIADDSTDLQHMMPGPDQFADAVGSLGITRRIRSSFMIAAGFSAARLVDIQNLRRAQRVHPRWRSTGLDARRTASRFR
jgi:thiosulfate/3-mercaptopyruvate sulfurtransferase